MGFIEYNANPAANYVDDCTIRAICTVTNTDWEYTYLGVCTQGFIMHNMPHANVVWGEYLYKQGFRKGSIPDTCPNCYTVRAFCADNPIGTFLLATGSHVIAVIDGTTVPSSTMIATPAAVEEYSNVAVAVSVPVWSGCCETLSIRNTSDQPILVQNANVILTRSNQSVMASC